VADADRIVGNQSYLTFNGSNIYITKLSPKIVRKLADSTDNGDYNSGQGMIANTQIPVSYYMEGAIEGRFRLSTTPSAFLANAVTNITQIPIVIGLGLSTVWGHGLCDISDFADDIPVEDIVTFTANVKSWGMWTPNA
jgi:hypothetical protein